MVVGISRGDVGITINRLLVCLLEYRQLTHRLTLKRRLYHSHFKPKWIESAFLLPDDNDDDSV